MKKFILSIMLAFMAITSFALPDYNVLQDNGANLTGLNGANISSGTIPLSALISTWGLSITNAYQAYANLIGTTITNNFETITAANLMGIAITNALNASPAFNVQNPNTIFAGPAGGSAAFATFQTAPNFNGQNINSFPSTVYTNPPLEIIWDDEFGNDWDHAASVAFAAGLQKLGLAHFLAITACDAPSSGTPGIAEAQVICTYYGMAPIFGNNTNTASFATSPSGNLMTLYNHSISNSVGGSNAVRVWRQAVAQSPRPVTIVCTGWLDDMTQFMLSQADDLSSLTGLQMLGNTNMVRGLFLLGGMYPATTVATGREYDFQETSIPALSNLWYNLPSSCLTVWIGYNWTGEYNQVVTLPANWLSYLDADNPAQAVFLGQNGAGRQAADQITLLAALGTNFQGSNYFQWIQGSNWIYAPSTGGPNYGSNVFTTGTAFPWYYATNVAPYSVISNTLNQIITLPPPAASRQVEGNLTNGSTVLNLSRVNIAPSTIGGPSGTPGYIGYDSTFFNVLNIDQPGGDAHFGTPGSPTIQFTDHTASPPDIVIIQGTPDPTGALGPYGPGAFFEVLPNGGSVPSLYISESGPTYGGSVNGNFTNVGGQFIGNGGGLTNLRVNVGPILLTYGPGSNLLINMSSYSNTANLEFDVICTNWLQFSFTNVPQGVSFLLRTYNGPSLTNSAWPNLSLASTNLYPCRTNMTGWTAIIPTTSTNSFIDWLFVASGTNVVEDSQSLSGSY